MMTNWDDPIGGISDYRLEFPHFGELDVEIPHGFVDSSLRINACPSFSYPLLSNGARVEIYIFRGGGAAYTVALFDARGDCKSSHHSEDWADVLDWADAMIEDTNESPLPPAAEESEPMVRCFVRLGTGKEDVFLHRRHRGTLPEHRSNPLTHLSRRAS